MKKSKTPSWRDIRILRRAIVARVPGDRFLVTVFKGCERIGRDKGNPLRGNFVASGLREAVGHVLHSLAPDAEVRRCTWFVQAKDTKTVTRRQRAHYIVQAGLPDAFVIKTLKMDVGDYSDPLLEAIDDLNKATHVRPETIVTKGTEIRTMFHDVLSGIDGLLDAAHESREAIKEAVAGVMQDAVFETLIAETIQELDEISTHTTIDGHYLESVDVVKIGAREIGYRVTGQVEVELQYGSNSDVSNDIGYRADDAYPYVATVTCDVARPMEVRSEEIDLTVDTSSFYE